MRVNFDGRRDRSNVISIGLRIARTVCWTFSLGLLIIGIDGYLWDQGEYGHEAQLYIFTPVGFVEVSIEFGGRTE